ncbi:hypothetical protein Ocin01_19876 [Orchesella cincta]|uniref:Uncharacterized protein n=1 Tax=Orchesella cincta TaxID=48709 RepID=A0A1D2M1G5_ORCCI|nr:hypothetical protein Ocin01_19876 [Orchesella cincta]
MSNGDDITVRPHLNWQATRDDQQLNNLNSLAACFPKVIQKLLLFLPVAVLKSARQCTKILEPRRRPIRSG